MRSWSLCLGGLQWVLCPLSRRGRKRALLYLQEQSLRALLPMGEHTPCLRLQAQQLPGRDWELLQMGLVWRERG